MANRDSAQDLSSIRQQFWNYLRDEKIEDICIAPHSGLLYHRDGTWHLGSSADLSVLTIFAREIAHSIAETAGVTLSVRHPSLDAQLESFGGISSFRAHIVIAPLSGSGTQITLRRLSSAGSPIEISHFGFTRQDLPLVRQHVRERKSILVCGPTGSGKTSLLRALLGECDKNERVAILEDSPEINPPNALSFGLRSRQNRFESVEGATWNLEQLVYEALRMRPDRIVLGECRGPEALGLLHAMQSGHRGVMCTIHAASAPQAIARYQNLVRMASASAIEMVGALWDAVIVLSVNSSNQRQAALHLVES